MKIDQPANSLGIARILNSEEDQHPDVPQEKIKTGIASASDAFVSASSDKSFLSSATGYGVVSGLQIGSENSNSVKVDPGNALNRLGQSISPQSENSGRNSFFDGKRLNAADLATEQQYHKDSIHLNTPPADNSLNSDSMSAVDFQQQQQYKKGVASHRSDLFANALQPAIEAIMGSAVFERLSQLTGKSSEELANLMNQYGLNAAHLPNPADARVSAFIQDPAFASFIQQDLLKALYGA